MKHIVVPIDFSKESLNGLRLAIVFANRFDSEVQMVYVQKSPADIGRVSFEDELKKANTSMKKLVEEYSPKMKKHKKLNYIVKKGKIYREVVNQAQAFPDSCIICSTHGASGFEEFFIGSNAFKIISATELPVITIRHGTVAYEIETILLPIDATADTRQKVPITVEVAKAFGATIQVVGVHAVGNGEAEAKIAAYTKQVCDYIEERGVTCVCNTINGSNIIDSIIEYALDVKADLISIMTEQDEPLSSLVLGSYAQQMLNKSPIPILSVSPKEIFILGSFRAQGASY
jgi:nucleotide-binding universal stress UspA family protein